MPTVEPDRRSGLVPALLKHWRRQRGLSQLDLAMAANVSARHISFLETGRSVPSPEMVVLLGTTLGVPLRQVNAMLRAAGHDPVYDEGDDDLPPAVADAIARLKAHHEPFPLVVVDPRYRILDANRGALAVIGAVLDVDLVAAAATLDPSDGSALAPLDVNLARLTFDPAGAQPHLVNFHEVGRQLLWRIQREVLADGDDGLRDLLDELLAMPTIEEGWRQVDLSVPSEPALVVHLRAAGQDLRFLTTVTAFQAPQHTAVERLRIETWLPVDDVTTDACHRLAPPGSGARRAAER